MGAMFIATWCKEKLNHHHHHHPTAYPRNRQSSWRRRWWTNRFTAFLWWGNSPNVPWPPAVSGHAWQRCGDAWYVDIGMCLCMYVRTYVRMYLSIYLSMYVSMYIYIYIHIICVSNTESLKKPFAAPLCFQQVQQVRQVRQREASIGAKGMVPSW